MELFQKKSECCGCGACENICARGAISMVPDEDGFMYPTIKHSMCVECGACRRVCGYQNILKKTQKTVLNAYAGMSQNEDVLRYSASGGIFKEIAFSVIEAGGVVFGCSLEVENGMLMPKHIGISDKQELWRLQGSKYVQSKMGDCYKEARQLLKSGRVVMFTGTPCQIDGLYNFLGGKYTEKLFTIDIICHGVPSIAMFQSYIKNQERRLHGKINYVSFRDKSQGWGLNGSLSYKDCFGINRKKRMPLQGFSYYKMFLEADIYRENCYTCKYANLNRVGDITLGDFWGIEEEHPELLIANGGEMDINKGSSCILVNSMKGKQLLENSASEIIVAESKIEKIAKKNAQLNHPCKLSDKRKDILNTYSKYGYKRLEKDYYKRFGVKGIVYRIWNYIPGRKCDE